MPRSLPALAAGILQSNKHRFVRSAAARFERTPLVPAYRVDGRLSAAKQAQRAALVVAELALKLHRLKDAYAKWPVFEAGPYFDLYPGHAADLLRVEETRYTLRLRLYCDLLLPVFRDAERFWAEGFLPAYHASRNGRRFLGLAASTPASDPLDRAAARLVELFNTAEETIAQTLDLLSNQIDVLATLGGLEERIQHRPRPGTRPAPDLPPALLRLPREMPTLTLDVLYPRPEEGVVSYPQRITQPAGTVVR